MVDVLFLGPGYPAEMPHFVHGLAEVGARVIGVGDQPLDAVPWMARQAMAHYVRVESWADEDGVMRTVHEALRGRNVDLVETLWEPTVVVAARLRESIGAPGLGVRQALTFRDKGLMKDALVHAGIRLPYAFRATTADGVREAAARVGYPLIVKPIAGAGSLDTYRVDDPAELERVMPRLAHIDEVSVEEFVDGEEFTYDTICAGGRIAHFNICEYRPRPLVGKQVEWISQQVIAHRDVDAPGLAGGRAMGEAVIAAMGVTSGFTHMEWYRTWGGEVVFGEIAARAPGGRLVDLMNYVSDIDAFRGWAEAVCYGSFSQDTTRRYNVAQVIKRAQGEGRISHVEGMEHLLAIMGEHIVNVDLLAVGQQRRDWKQVVLSDGLVVARHPDLHAVYAMADRIGTDLQMYASW
jgi:formate-dependent phosphoribosylglycinamide formyltransferase (GAR transformylase)